MKRCLMDANSFVKTAVVNGESLSFTASAIALMVSPCRVYNGREVFVYLILSRLSTQQRNNFLDIFMLKVFCAFR